MHYIGRIIETELRTTSRNEKLRARAAYDSATQHSNAFAGKHRRLERLIKQLWKHNERANVEAQEAAASAKRRKDHRNHQERAEEIDFEATATEAGLTALRTEATAFKLPTVPEEELREPKLYAEVTVRIEAASQDRSGAQSCIEKTKEDNSGVTQLSQWITQKMTEMEAEPSCAEFSPPKRRKKIQQPQRPPRERTGK